MTEMDAAILYGREDVRVERIPLPPVGLGEVRIRICAALTCGTDLKVYRRGYHARMLTPPCVFGHELAGEIDVIGEGVTVWKAGDRVVAANSAPCGECFYCKKDRPEICEDLIFVNGAFAQYITLPERIVRKNLLRIPADLSFEAAAMVEPLACAAHGLEETGIGEGQVVAVIGCGPIGLLFIRLCDLAGSDVIAISRNPSRLRAAELMGADNLVTGRSSGEMLELARSLANGGRGPDAVVECVGTIEAWELAVAMVRKGGVVNLFGGCESGTQICLDTGRLHYDALTLKATFHHTPATVRKALEHLASGQIPYERIITDYAPLKDVPGVFRNLAAGDGNLKVAIVP